jgi:hypothetical protein
MAQVQLCGLAEIGLSARSRDVTRDGWDSALDRGQRIRCDISLQWSTIMCHR